MSLTVGQFILYCTAVWWTQTVGQHLIADSVIHKPSSHNINTTSNFSAWRTLGWCCFCFMLTLTVVEPEAKRGHRTSHRTEPTASQRNITWIISHSFWVRLKVNLLNSRLKEPICLNSLRIYSLVNLLPTESPCVFIHTRCKSTEKKKPLQHVKHCVRDKHWDLVKKWSC